MASYVFIYFMSLGAAAAAAAAAAAYVNQTVSQSPINSSISGMVRLEVDLLWDIGKR